jgi:putative chitinase
MDNYKKELEFLETYNSLTDDLFTKYSELDNLKIKAFLLTTVKYESNYKLLEEKFTYSKERFIHIFSNKKYLKVKNYLPCSGGECERIIANAIYNNRLGNQDINDGWKFRGRGYIQITGRYNYNELSKMFKSLLDKDIDLVKNPEMLVNDKEIAILAVILFFIKYKIYNYPKDKSIRKQFKYMQDKINSKLPKSEIDKRFEYFNNMLTLFTTLRDNG